MPLRTVRLWGVSYTLAEALQMLAAGVVTKEEFRAALKRKENDNGLSQTG